MGGASKDDYVCGGGGGAEGEGLWTAEGDGRGGWRRGRRGERRWIATVAWAARRWLQWEGGGGLAAVDGRERTTVGVARCGMMVWVLPRVAGSVKAGRWLRRLSVADHGCEEVPQGSSWWSRGCGLTWTMAMTVRRRRWCCNVCCRGGCRGCGSRGSQWRWACGDGGGRFNGEEARIRLAWRLGKGGRRRLGGNCGDKSRLRGVLAGREESVG